MKGRGLANRAGMGACTPCGNRGASAAIDRTGRQVGMLPQDSCVVPPGEPARGAECPSHLSSMPRIPKAPSPTPGTTPRAPGGIAYPASTDAIGLGPSSAISAQFA